MHHLAEDEVVRGDHEEVAVQVALHARDDMQAEVTGRCVSGQAIHKHPLAQLHGHAALVHRDLEHMRAGLDRREAASGHVLDHHPCHALPARQHSTHVSYGYLWLDSLSHAGQMWLQVCKMQSFEAIDCQCLIRQMVPIDGYYYGAHESTAAKIGLNTT